MKRMMGIVAMAAMLGAAAWAQEGPHRDRPAGAGPEPAMDPSRQMELQNRQLELRAHENKIKFEREMMELKLQEHRAELDRQRMGPQERMGRGPGPMGRCPVGGFRFLVPLFGMCLLIHVLLTVWVYQDIRRRNAGSGLWIVITLLTGFCGALLYALVRLGDNKSA
jgi:hypothetical protein